MRAMFDCVIYCELGGPDTSNDYKPPPVERAERLLRDVLRQHGFTLASVDARVVRDRVIVGDNREGTWPWEKG